MASFFRLRKGFTLTEILVAAAILAILAAAAIPLSKIAVKREKEIELRRDLRLMREAVDAYKKMADEKKIEFESDTDGYPPDLETLVKGVKLASGDKDKAKGSGEKIIKFLRRVPKDPMTSTFDWGLLSSQDAPEAMAWGEQNVFDVYTKSRGKALDGSKYRDW
jgi:general secretion pathway protein G